MKIKINICLIIAAVFCINLYAQNPIKQVFFKTTTSKVFAVPDSTDMKAITNFDLAKMQSHSVVTNTDLIIDQNHDLTITNINEQKPRYENDYEFEVGKVISNKFGTVLYGHDGNKLYNNQYPEVNKEFEIQNDAIESYGLFPAITIDNNLIDLYSSIGFTTSISADGAFSAINDSIEFYLDTKKMIVETRIFKGNELQISDWKQYQYVDNYLIPKVFVMTTYDKLSTGIRLQINEIVNYNSYTIINENNEAVVSYIEKVSSFMNNEGIAVNKFKELEKKNPNIVVFPNPSTDNISVEIPLFATDYVNVDITNTLGTVVMTLNDVKNDSKVNIDISTLRSGVYILRCGNGNQMKTARFVKQ